MQLFDRRVRIIHLSYNRITNITSMSFANQHNLRHLMLDNNRLEDEGIDSAALKYTTKLEVRYQSNCDMCMDYYDVCIFFIP